MYETSFSKALGNSSGHCTALSQYPPSSSLLCMKFNTPLPQPLPKECEKAAKICACFSFTPELVSLYALMLSTPVALSNLVKSFVDNGNNGLDGVRRYLKYLYWNLDTTTLSRSYLDKYLRMPKASPYLRSSRLVSYFRPELAAALL